MKILIISNMYPSKEYPYYGVFVKNCESALIASGFDIDKVVIDKKSKSLLNKIHSYLLFYISIINTCRHGSYDSLYVHYVSHVALPIMLLRLLGKKFDIVSHVHGGDVKKLDGYSGTFFKIKRYLSTLMINNSRLVISPSKSYADFIHKEYGTERDKFVVYPSGGINENVFKFNEKSVRRPVIGYAGRLVKTKNVDLLLHAMALNAHDLEIVGDGDEKNQLEALVCHLGLESRVKFLGTMNQQELSNWYSTINTLVYPSSSESLGLVPIEAIACGAYPILSDIPAFNELKELGVSVTLLKSLSAEQINIAINEVLKNSDNRDIVVNNAKIILQNYQSSNFSGTLENVFN